jgi:hypothetical protein
MAFVWLGLVWVGAERLSDSDRSVVLLTTLTIPIRLVYGQFLKDYAPTDW